MVFVKGLVLLVSVLILSQVNAVEESSSRIEDPFANGDLPVSHTAYRQALSLTLDTNLDVYAPNATGNFPVFYFVTGFGGTIPGDAHGILLSSIASHGVVVVAAWKVGSPVSSFDPTWMESTISFVENRLERDLLNQEGYVSGFHVDYRNSFMGAHSAGSHQAVIQLQMSCRNYRGLVLIDPVDGDAPIPENVNMSVITPGEKVNFTLPTLQLVTGLDPVPDAAGIACAPEELSGRRYFDAMNGPTWYVNATAYGHLDLLNPGYVQLGVFCPSTDAPKDVYIQFLSGEIISFVFATLDPANNCFLFDNLEKSGLLNIDTENDYSANGWERCTPLPCTHSRSYNWFFSS